MIKNTKKFVLVFFIFINANSCKTKTHSKNELKRENVFIQESRTFSKNVNLDSYRLLYQDKRIIGEFKEYKTKEYCKKFVSGIKKRKNFYVSFEKGFKGDTVFLYKNDKLVYYSANISTSWRGSAGYTGIRKGNSKYFYLGVRINSGETYWCLVDYEYLVADIDKNKNIISVRFNNETYLF